MNDGSNNPPKTPRRRGLTSLTLEWLAEKLRRAEQVKDAVQQGTYQVDSSKVAKALVNPQPPGG